MTRTVWLNGLRRVCEVNNTKNEPAISILPTKDGAGLEVMVMTTLRKSPSPIIMSSHWTRPEFIPVCEPQTLPNLQYGLLAKSGHWVLHCGKDIFVWSTARNLWASWKADQFLNKIFAYEDMIVGVGIKTIALWDMPAPRCDTREASRLENHLPLLTLSHPFPSHPDFEITS